MAGEVDATARASTVAILRRSFMVVGPKRVGFVIIMCLGPLPIEFTLDSVAAFALDHCRDPIHASDRLVLAWPDGERSS